MEYRELTIPVRGKRRFVEDELLIENWNNVAGYYENLQKREIHSLNDLENWLQDWSELDAVMKDEIGWRYIKMSIDTTDKNLANAFMFFINEIEPKIAPFTDRLNKKLVENPHTPELGDEYFTFIRKVRKDIEVFSEKNISLFTKLQAKQKEYGAISAKMTVVVDDEELTLQQAAKFLLKNDRNLREKVYQQIANRRLEDKDILNKLYSELIQIRHQVALNAGYKNFRDYMFDALGRFDYTPEDCFDFHDAIASEVVSVINKWDIEQQQKLNVEELKPWDTDVDAKGREPLQPFNEAKELVDKTVECFDKINPYFAERITIMQEMKHLDLASKTGKAPGGFNYPLYEIGVPFIFMNAVGTHQDLITMVHEGGHAVQSFLNIDLKLTAFKALTSEVAELASMSMELISMDAWDVFYPNAEDLKRAKIQQLHRSLQTLPWVATIDKFQHWVYENPNHSIEQREQKWNELMNIYGSEIVDWSSCENARTYLWQKQLHLFEVPFYYIEYAMAQLGAIAVWKNYKNNPQTGIQQYMDALSLGYTKTIDEIYQTAGIEFNFSREYVKSLIDFVEKELEKVS